MLDKKQSMEITTGGPDYVTWRGDLLAELALARVAELSVHRPKNELGYDFLVAAPSGVCFFVLVKGFSSKTLKLEQVGEIADLHCQIETDRIHHAKDSHTPVFIFLIDADTDHGRFLRLDTVDLRDTAAPTQLLHFPIDNTINKDGIERLVAALEEHEKAMSR